MKGPKKSVLYGILGVCFVGQGLLMRGLGYQPSQSDYDPVTVENKKTGVFRVVKKLKPGVDKPAFQGIYSSWSRDFAPRKTVAAAGLSPDQLLFALAGFREMIAGILWVRADSFFDTGNYDAILPIIRLVTILDPSQIDVYATGMWHIGYNFTDEEQRSDRRYIPSALALGKEGCRQNPETYEMFFETGWMWYHKIDDDYPQAVKWFEQAQTKPDMIPARKNLLAMAFQRDGQPDAALDTYSRLLNKAESEFDKDQAFGNRQLRDTIQNNIDTTLVRMVQRGWVAEKEGRPLTGYDTDPAFDVGFSAKATIIDSRVIKFEGTWNVLPVGTRVRVVLRDKDYTVNLDGKDTDVGKPAGMNWDYSNDVNLDPPRDRTFMMDQLFVRNRRFSRKVDLSKDPTMYPFTEKEYWLEFYYNPRSAPPHIQDKFGYNGEGMTDKNFLRNDVRPGQKLPNGKELPQKVVYVRLPISRDMILRRGEWQDKVPVIKTPNYVETANNYDKDETLIDIPSLRSGGGAEKK